MDLIQAVVLGIVQGLTEFLPISSSGHLIIAHALFGSRAQTDLAFDVALHIGTIAAVLVYFWNDFLSIIRNFLTAAMKRDFSSRDSLLGLWIVLGTIPAAVAGLLLQKPAEELFRDPRLVAVMLILVAGVMFLAERAGKQERRLTSIGWLDGLLIGIAQATALIPGVSRSGATISAGLFRGLERGDAARFSFLLATPITLGAALLEVYKLSKESMSSEQILPFVVGITTAGLVGFACIAFLLRFLQRRSLLVFVVYRVVVGIAVLIYFSVRAPS